jgi:hypothetical protein
VSTTLYHGKGVAEPARQRRGGSDLVWTSRRTPADPRPARVTFFLPAEHQPGSFKALHLASNGQVVTAYLHLQVADKAGDALVCITKHPGRVRHLHQTPCCSVKAPKAKQAPT